MNHKKDTNEINELIERFGDPVQAQKLLADIRAGDALMDQHPAPKPDAELLADIKGRMRTQLDAQRRGVHRWRLSRIAVTAAAVIAIAALIWTHGPQQPDRQPIVASQPQISESLWESEDVIEADAELATLAAQVSDLQEDIYALHFDESVDYDDSQVSELEAELIEINSDFWKG